MFRLTRNTIRLIFVSIIVLSVLVFALFRLINNKESYDSNKINAPVADIAYDDDKLVLGYLDGTIWFFDLVEKTSTRLRHDDAGFCGVEFIPNSSWLVAALCDQTLIVFDSADGFRQHIYELDQDPYQQILSLAASPDGQYLVIGGWGPTIQIYHLSDNGELIDLDRQYGIPKNPAVSRVDWAWSMAFSPDSRELVIGLEIGEIYRWDTETFTPDLLFRADSFGFVWSLDYLLDAREIIPALTDPSLGAWSITSQLTIMENSDSTAPSDDSSLDEQPAIVAVFGDGILKIFDTATGEILNISSGGTDGLRSLAVLSEGRYVLLGYDTGEVKVWDRENASGLISFETFFENY